MIKTETIGAFVRTFSDEGFYIRGGDPIADYVDATDPIGSDRTYTETDIPIEDADEETDATVEDYEEALRQMGVDIS